MAIAREFDMTTTRIRLLVLLCVSYVAIFSDLARAGERQLPAAGPPPPGFVDFVLPRSVDPTGRPIRARHRSAIFVERALVVTYEKRWPDGIVRRTTTAFDPGVKLERTAARLRVIEADGTVRDYPASSSVTTDSGARTISVVAPGQLRPLSIGKERKPDYVVP
jgi:hypothetical protein